MGRVNQDRAQSDDIDHQETRNRTHDGDDLTPATLEVGVSITDANDNTIENFVGNNLSLNGGVLSTQTAPDVRMSINDLFVANAEQDFELGLTQLNYEDGQFEIFADSGSISGTSNVTLSLGSSLNGNGYVVLENGAVGSISSQKAKFDGHTNDVFGVDTDSTHVFSGSKDATVKKLDKDTLSQQNEFTGHSIRVSSVFVDGTTGYSGGYDDVVYKWDTDTLTQQGAFTNHTNDIEAIHIDQNGYSASSNGAVKQWDKDTLSESGEFTFTYTPISLHVSDTDRIGFVGTQGNEIQKFFPNGMGQGGTYTEHPTSVTSLYYDEGEDIGYSGDSNGNVHKWDTSLFKQNEFNGHSAEVGAIYIEGDYGYSGDRDGNIYKWDTETMTQQDTFDSHSDAVTDITIGDSFYGYSASRDDTVRKWGGGIQTKVNGNVQHNSQNFDFVPSSAVVSDDVAQLPSGTDVYYTISDDQGNTVTVQRSEVDTEVDLSTLSSSTVSTTVYLTRPDTETTSPKLDSWAVYLNN